MGTLTALHRRVVGLSAAAAQKPEMIIVEEADRNLDDASLERFGLLCQRVVQSSGTCLILIGQRVGALVGVPPAAETEADDRSRPGVR